MDETQMEKFASIARTEGVTWIYVVYLEEALLGRPFDGKELAKQIYEAAMSKHGALLRKRRDAILSNVGNTTESEMTQAKYFARTNGVSDEYACYVEEILLNKRQFDLEQCIERVRNAAMAKYEWHLMHKIEVGTGIAVGDEYAV